MYTCLCLIFGFATLLLFMLAAGCYGVKQPIAALAGSLCLVAAAALILVSLTRRDGVPLFGTLAACTVGFHGPSTVVLVSFFFVFEFFWRGRSLFDLPATWALPKDVAVQTAVRAFSAAAFGLDSLAHAHEKFSAKLAFKVVQGVTGAFDFVGVPLLAILELCAAFAAWLFGAQDFVFPVAPFLVSSAIFGRPEGGARICDTFPHFPG